jgi:RNA ligase
MNYKFPEIRTIDDVLPHVEGRDEFNINDKGDFTVVNYAVAFEDTFAMADVNDMSGAIRRECRGLKFYPSGKIAARPFHKFFNIGEREETQPHVLNFGVDHIVMTKEDGSFLHPIDINGKIRWCTKAGITEVSTIAEKFISKNIKYEKFARECVSAGLTPIFEYVGPYNKVVIDYAEENMILLAVRHNMTGEYMNIF